ncbi:hypothetical protein NOR_02554 [Metarhizium rileyi]|uniref:Uncharacterized protein n=1 Tax=Metarhizium rileyi (strain RCEF 4871) TaxID=1649241 RepID=A0A162JNV7_METRR|nr:hypothetical protein NOR_02554 [Metarhizium rileyi RCEF 4871]
MSSEQASKQESKPAHTYLTSVPEAIICRRVLHGLAWKPAMHLGRPETHQTHQPAHHRPLRILTAPCDSFPSVWDRVTPAAHERGNLPRQYHDCLHTAQWAPWWLPRSVSTTGSHKILPEHVDHVPASALAELECQH